MNIAHLLKLLALHGGKIVNAAKYDDYEIEQAKASGRICTENGLTYVWEPDIDRFPRTEEGEAILKKWYPIPYVMPDELKPKAFLFQ